MKWRCSGSLKYVEKQKGYQVYRNLPNRQSNTLYEWNVAEALDKLCTVTAKLIAIGTPFKLELPRPIIYPR